jgi:protein-S-isoprenylcysteine O-methyltransferase Ste14
VSPGPAADGAGWVGLRALVWAVLFVGAVAVYVPWRYFGVALGRLQLASPGTLLGLLLVAAGGGVMFACVREFVARGRGTPAPMDPPRALVVHGPYRVVRNPMYIGLLLALLGELTWSFSWGLVGYIAAWLASIHLFVVLYEEPTLRRRFGDPYVRYTGQVGRWWPRWPKRANGP